MMSLLEYHDGVIATGKHDAVIAKDVMMALLLEYYDDIIYRIS
jgi:hypothetical protein